MILLECSDCNAILEDEELVIRFPDIPNLLERVAPGELVPFGECPRCNALAHKAQPIPGKRAFINVDEGKFEVKVDGEEKAFSERKPSLVSDDPEKVREFLIRSRAGRIMCSSSVDFCEEYGMDPKLVEQLFGER